LSLRKTGRIEGAAVYGDIEIEKGGVLAGEVSSIKGNEAGAKKAEGGQRQGAPAIAFDTIRSAATSDQKNDAVANRK
jgi:hypothetical protein